MQKVFTLSVSLVIFLFTPGFLAETAKGQVAGAGNNQEIASGGNVFQFKTIVRKNVANDPPKVNSKTATSKNPQKAKNTKQVAKTKNKVTTSKNSGAPNQIVEEKENLEIGKIVNLPKPPYPKTAAAVGASGTVEVSVTIDEEGNVVSAEALSGHALLRGHAVEAAKLAKFTPTLLNKKPVMVTGVLVYNFIK
jgi:TonB family protein